MSNLDQSTKNWLEEFLIPELKIFYFKSESKVKYKFSTPEDSKYLSTVIFIDLQFFDKEKKTIQVVVKRPSVDSHVKEYLNFENAFNNEILFYKNFSPLYNCCPKFIDVERQDKLTIVTENLSSEGYRLNSMKVNVNDEFVLAAVRELAKFHANGYIQKCKTPEEFHQIVKKIKTNDQVHTKKTMTLVNSTLSRVFNYLREKKYDPNFCDKLENYLKSPYSVIIELCKPVEPLATLCHGDFTINNILYKEENDKIVIKLIDFSMISYCSPFFDLSVFLLLNGSREQRREKFGEIFNTYCDTLLHHLRENKISNLEIYSKERLLSDYKRQAIIGFIIACFYRPCLMGCFEKSSDNLENLNFEEKCNLYGSIGGEDVTKLLVEMLFDLKEYGCLDHMINN